MSVSFKHIKPLLQTGTNKASRWLSYIGLGIGVLLLLCSIQMYINIQQLLKGNVVRKEGSDFISITKTITNETMGQTERNLFHKTEIEEVKSQPFVEDVSPLLANQFRVQLSAGAIIPFSTDLFIETLDNSFIDTIPPGFSWQEGQIDIPLILSSDFLEIYNVFAPGQGLPQVSPETVSGIPILVTCEGNGLRQTFRARVVALSDRINSVLAPKTFLDWANKTFGDNNEIRASRLYIKTKDANNTALLDFLDQKDYKVNKDKTKFGRVKQVLQGIFSALGIFGLLVVILALMLFSFYLQLVIARSKDNLQLLITLGYSPTWLSRNVSQQFVPVYAGIVFIALLVTGIIQFLFHRFAMYQRPELSSVVHWSIIVLGVGLVGLSVFTNYRLIRKLLYKMVLNRFVKPSLLLILAVNFLIPFVSHAQEKTYVPVRGSEERKVQMDLLRNEFTTKFNGQQLIFETIGDFYKSTGTWALIYVYVYQTGGKPVDFNNSKYRKDYEEGMIDNNGIFALFKKKNGKWTLITYADFPTDVPIGCWWKEYNAPKSIFGSAAQAGEDCL